MSSDATVDSFKVPKRTRTVYGASEKESKKEDTTPNYS